MSLSAEHEQILQTLRDLERKKQLFGAYKDIPEEVYNDPRCPGFRSGDVKTVYSKSYSHWMLGEKKKGASLNLGKGFHSAMESDEVAPSGSRSADIKAMMEKTKDHPDAKPLIAGAQRETTYWSIDEETGLLKRCRVDLYKPYIIGDYKTARDASARGFSSDARRLLYRISAAYYLEIVSEVTGVVHRDFYLIAVESAEPFEACVHRVDDCSIEAGKEAVRETLRKLKSIYVGGQSAWRGYPLGIQDIQI